MTGRCIENDTSTVPACLSGKRGKHLGQPYCRAEPLVLERPASSRRPAGGSCDFAKTWGQALFERFKAPELRFAVDAFAVAHRLVYQRTLAQPGHAGHHHQHAERDVDIHILKIVRAPRTFVTPAGFRTSGFKATRSPRLYRTSVSR